jgi:hypothetical protein
MKTQILSSLWVALALTVSGQSAGRDYDWNDLAQRHELSGGEIVSVDGRTVVKVENTNGTPMTVSLFKIENPPVSNAIYQVRGRLKYEKVEGDGYLEMWNVFASPGSGQPEARFFFRTLAAGGASGKITGSSDWRSFTLPFDATGASTPLKRIEINLCLAGRGTVYLGAMNLADAAGGLGGLGGAGLAGTWWSNRQAGLIGGIGGSVLGCGGALIGCLAGLGRARRLVLGLTWGFIGLGVASLIAGVAALVLRQPYGVWYVLLLGGIIGTAVFGANLRTIRKRYDDLEVRRMTSADAMRG